MVKKQRRLQGRPARRSPAALQTVLDVDLAAAVTPFAERTGAPARRGGDCGRG